MDGHAEQSVPVIEQAEIDAPAIDPQGAHGTGSARHADACEHLAHERGQVPDEGPTEMHRVIWEAMDFLEVEPVAIEHADHGPTAFGTQVDGEHPGATAGSAA